MFSFGSSWLWRVVCNSWGFRVRRMLVFILFSTLQNFIHHVSASHCFSNSIKSRSSISMANLAPIVMCINNFRRPELRRPDKNALANRIITKAVELTDWMNAETQKLRSLETRPVWSTDIWICVIRWVLSLIVQEFDSKSN